MIVCEAIYENYLRLRELKKLNRESNASKRVLNFLRIVIVCFVYINYLLLGRLLMEPKEKCNNILYFISFVYLIFIDSRT